MNTSQTCIVEARFSKLIKDIWMRIAVSSRKVTPYELLRNRGILKKKTKFKGPIVTETLGLLFKQILDDVYQNRGLT